jgi:ribosomal protein S18 acetylase RimI-like enzyme
MKILIFIILLLINNLLSPVEISLHFIDQKTFIQSLSLEDEMLNIYIRSFSNIYSSEWSDDFERYMLDYYHTYCKRFKNNNDMILCICKADTNLCGWVLFDKYNNKASIKLICVDPAYQRLGVGKKLVFSIRQMFPEINHIKVATRKPNNISPLFYKSLGFENSNACLSENSNEEMLLFEWLIPANL